MPPRMRKAPSCAQAVSIWKRFYSAPTDGSIPPAKQKYVPTTGTYPKGFLVSSAHVGVKPSNIKFEDLVLIKSERPAVGAGTFTKNVFQAAPITVCKERLKTGEGKVRGVIINSGCANAVTGKGGIQDAQRMCAAADSAMSFENAAAEGGNLVMSTGVIGQRLPIQKIIDKIPTAHDSLGNTHDHWLRAARAICTTDTFPKLASRSFNLPGMEGAFSIAGMAKGAGMIHPNMGTLLSVICTDAPLSASDAQSMLREAVSKTFNRISIDGDTSTNDTVLFLANGAASSTSSTAEPAKLDPEAKEALQTELTTLCATLSQLIVRDGEGATKFVTIRIRGAPSEVVGHRLAESIATSNLVKTALYGQDANWGRILCAMGYAHQGSSVTEPGDIRPERTSVSFVQVVEREDASGKALKKGGGVEVVG